MSTGLELMKQWVLGSTLRSAIFLILKANSVLGVSYRNL